MCLLLVACISGRFHCPRSPHRFQLLPNQGLYQGFAPGMQHGLPASTIAALLSLMRQVGGAAGEVALERSSAALLSLRAWKDPAPNYLSRRPPETGLPDPAVTRVAVRCLTTACAAVHGELGVAAVAGG